MASPIIDFISCISSTECILVVYNVHNIKSVLFPLLSDKRIHFDHSKYSITNIIHVAHTLYVIYNALTKLLKENRCVKYKA